MKKKSLWKSFWEAMFSKRMFYITGPCIAATAVAAVFAGIQSFRPARGSGRAFEQLTVEEALKYMSYEPDYVIIDVRDPEAYDTAHLDRAVNIPYDRIVRDAETLLPDPEQTIYVYGEDEEQPQAAAQKLSDMDFTSVAVIGSYSDWVEAMYSESSEAETELFLVEELEPKPILNNLVE